MAVTAAFALTGSFCAIKNALRQMKKLAEMGVTVLPVMSSSVYNLDTRFFTAAELRGEVEAITGRTVINTIGGAEPLGPQCLADILIIAPCTSNTAAKLVSGVNDTPVTMAAKSVLRNGRPVLLAISTNDGLAASAANIGALLNRKNIYFVPFGQDDPAVKPRSLAAEIELLVPAVMAALDGRQLQPILVGRELNGNFRGLSG